MTTLAREKRDLYRTFERFGCPDMEKLIRELVKAGIWPKGRGIPNADHIAALTIASLLAVPTSQLGTAYSSAARLPLADAKAHATDVQGRLTSVDLEEARRDEVSFLVKRNMATLHAGIRYLLAELVDVRRSPVKAVKVLNIVTGSIAQQATVWLDLGGFFITLEYRDGAANSPSIRMSGNIAGEVFEALSKAAQPFVERSNLKIWDTGEMPPLEMPSVGQSCPSIQ